MSELFGVPVETLAVVLGVLVVVALAVVGVLAVATASCSSSVSATWRDAGPARPSSSAA